MVNPQPADNDTEMFKDLHFMVRNVQAARRLIADGEIPTDKTDVAMLAMGLGATLLGFELGNPMLLGFELGDPKLASSEAQCLAVKYDDSVFHVLIMPSTIEEWEKHTS